jgi:hypothetical protein
MKNPRDRETTDRSEMMCPRCQREGLEAHPAYEDEYSGRVELLKATRCPNEDCDFHRGTPREKIEMQMPEKRITDFISLPENIDAKDVLTVVFVIGIGIAMAASYGIGPFGSAEENPTLSNQDIKTITGDVPIFQGESPQLFIYQDGEQVTRVDTANGSYEIKSNQLKSGKYTVYLNYEDRMGNPPGKTLQINERSNNVSLNFNSTPSPLDIDIDQNAARSEFNLNYSNPTNIQTLNLSISPLEGESIQRSKSISTRRTQNILMPVIPAEQEFKLNAPYTYEKFSETGSYRGQPITYNVSGNADAENVNITLPDISTVEASTRKFNIAGSGSSETITVASEETLGPAEIIISNGTSSQVEQATGVWDNQDNITIKSGTEEFTSGTLQVEPNPVTTRRTIEDSISDTQITHFFDGNMPVKNASIRFTGGNIQESLSGQGSLSLNGNNGTTGIQKTEVATLSESGSYRLEWNPDIVQNNDLTTLFYEINGERTTVNSGGSRILGLSKGDKIEIGGEAILETMVDDREPPNFAKSLDSDLEVKNIEFSDENPSTEQTITVSVTIKNTGVSEVTDTVELYQNKEKVGDEQITLEGGRETTLGLFEFGEPVTSEDPGLSVWHVNDRDAVYLPVGINEKTYGIANIEAELFDIGTRGKVSVDTNGDGNVDCEAEATGGVCEFEEFPSGENTFAIEETGVSGTSYILNYTAQENPTDVKVDIGADGLVDLNNEGRLLEAQSEPIEIPPGEVKIEMESANQIPFNYVMTWESNAVVNNPVVYVDGEQVVSNEGSFVESRSYKIGTLSEGDHEINFQSGSGGYEAKVKWREQEEQSFPRAIVDGQQVCTPAEFANNLTCVLTETGVAPGSHTLRFTEAPSEVFNYRINQQAKAVASDVTIFVNGRTSETFTRSSLEPNEWESLSNTDDFIRGSNEVIAEVQEENGIVPDVNITLRYLLDSSAVEDINITVIDSEGNTNNIRLPRGQSQILGPTEVELPARWFSVGSNKVRFDPTPVDGVFDISGRLILHEDETITFRTLG